MIDSYSSILLMMVVVSSLYLIAILVCMDINWNKLIHKAKNYLLIICGSSMIIYASRLNPNTIIISILGLIVISYAYHEINKNYFKYGFKKIPEFVEPTQSDISW